MRYRRLLRRSFEPRKEFLDATRSAFLAEVAKRRVGFVAPQFTRRAWGINAVRYGLVFAGIVLFSTSGLVAYADNTNVGVDNTLYPLKRVAERVRLSVVPAIKETQLREEFAQRRANELIVVEQKQASDNVGNSKQTRKWETKAVELRTEFRNTIAKIEEKNDSESPVVSKPTNEKGLCRAVEAVEKNAGNGKSGSYKKFEERCKRLLITEATPDNTNTLIEIHNTDERVTDVKIGANGTQQIDEKSGQFNTKVIEQ